MMTAVESVVAAPALPMAQAVVGRPEVCRDFLKVRHRTEPNRVDRARAGASAARHPHRLASLSFP
jgi:hypothetical protein